MLAGASRHRPETGRRTVGPGSVRIPELHVPSILCIDDDAAMRHTLRRILRHEGWSVLADVSADLAMARMLTMRFDALIVDLKLPGISGLEFLRKLRGQGNNTPAIVLTGFPTVSSAIEATKLGVGYLLKRELTSAGLVTAVRLMLSTSGDRPSAPVSPVQSAIRQLIGTLSKDAIARPTARDDASRFFAALLCDPGLTFVSFVIAADTLHALMDASIDQSQLVAFLREKDAKLSRRLDEATEALLVRLVKCLTSGGGCQPAEEQGHIARCLEIDAERFARLLQGIGLSWPQCRRVSIVRQAVASLANDHDYVSQIAYRLGYDHSTAFDRDFHLVLGMAPTAYRRLTSARRR